MSVRVINSRVYDVNRICDFWIQAQAGETFIVDQLVAEDLEKLKNFLQLSNSRCVIAESGDFMTEEGVIFLIPIRSSYRFDGMRLYVAYKEAVFMDQDPMDVQERISREQYFTSGTREMVCTHTLIGVFKYVSPTSFSMLGYHPEELVGTDSYDYIHPDDRERIRQEAHLPSLRGELNGQIIRYRFRRANGSYAWLDTYSYYVRNDAGDISSIVSRSRDITDLKEVEAQLRSSEERFRSMADNIPGVIYLSTHGSSYRMIYLNKEVENLTGYPRIEFLSNQVRLADLYHPADRDMIFDEVNVCIKKRKPFRLVYRLRHKAGHWIWIAEYGQGIFENDTLTMIDGVLMDITEQKQAEARLQQREANLKAIFESTGSMIGLFNTRMELIEYNQAFEDYVKLTDNVDLYPGIPLVETLNVNLREIFREHQLRALAGEAFVVPVEYPTFGGEILHFLISHNPIYQNNQVVGVSIFVENVTELKNSQKRLEQYAENLEALVVERTSELSKKNEALEKGNQELAQALSDLKATQAKLIHAEKMASLGVLSAGIGHEINNPLNFIKNGCAALKNELEDHCEADMHRVQPFIDIINDGVNRAAAIVKSLNHFSRQVDKMDEHCVFAHIIENCLLILNSRLKGRVEVERRYEDPQLFIQGNEGRLHQAFLNILSNAEQAISEEGTITITLSNSNQETVVCIEDNGGGIAPDHLKRLGDPFFTTKPPGKGTGLGLFITYSIIREMKGEMKIESQMKQGTKVTLLFPNT